MDFRISDNSLNSSTDDASETASLSSQTQSSDVSLPIRSANHATKDTLNLLLSSSRGDINTAAALRAQYAIDTPKPARRRQHKKATTRVVDDNAPEVAIVDQTASLPLHSKKTERLQRKQQKKTERLLHQQSVNPSLLNLPTELQTEVLAYLLPTDIAALRQTCHHFNNLTTTHESSITRAIIRRRYWTLHRCFPLPIPFHAVPVDAHSALLNPRRQEMLNIHRKSYHQHVQMVDPTETCTCMTCVFAWNNLCLIVDLHHWQPCLENREPIPVIPRGQHPDWNRDLLERNARLVRLAMESPIVYARILQMHLDTVVGTILRHARWRRNVPAAHGTKTASGAGGNGGASTGGGGILTVSAAAAATLSAQTPKTKPRLYRLADTDVDGGTDAFLERSGPPSYDFPYMRDNYYSLEAYLPNRKWSGESGSWHYYGLPPFQHERDLEWVRSWGTSVGWRG